MSRGGCKHRIGLHRACKVEREVINEACHRLVQTDYHWIKVLLFSIYHSDTVDIQWTIENTHAAKAATLYIFFVNEEDLAGIIYTRGCHPFLMLSADWMDIISGYHYHSNASDRPNCTYQNVNMIVKCIVVNLRFRQMKPLLFKFPIR